ncbi:hypothetical protein WS50_30755 [Burkholderia territorii]|nr:hypothetical protein WS47_28690 [Burkholderia territorii]KUZ04772.1 hypothetical protein WS50_30755 [Burkholderia territorii]
MEFSIVIIFNELSGIYQVFSWISGYLNLIEARLLHGIGDQLTRGSFTRFRLASTITGRYPDIFVVTTQPALLQLFRQI